NGSNTGNYKPQTYTGARRHGTNYSPGYARINGNDRLATGKTNTPSIDLKSRPNGRSPIGTAPVPGASDRSDAGRNPASGTPGVNGRNPTDAPKFNGRDQVNTRPNTRDADISRRIQDGQGDDNRSGRDSRDFNTERRNTSIPRDNTPTRRTEPSTIERPARSGSQETTPSRRFDNGSSGRNNDTPRPSQSFRNNDGNSSGRSIDFGGSSGRSSGSSGGHSSGGSSGGGGGRSGGGGGGGGRSGGGGRH
ncbi:MAG: hypothetical protein KGS48_13375, partial [Bacteroidetes bacterium]|nr:hypothetical protein [Bacteroidota bacterium]